MGTDPGTIPGAVAVQPSFPVPPPATWTTLNVDGGVTDNDPFDLAHDLLASQNPAAQNGHNPPTALAANCAVVTVAPFPASDKYNPNFNPNTSANIWKMLGTLFGILISQSRFQGESLASLMGGVSFSRFVVAPSDPGQTDGHALQCGLLGAFGGFLERGYRAHDFLLGRRNCQKFLMSQFCLPAQNPVIAAGLASAGAFAGQMDAFLVGPPNATVQPQAKVWMSIIPLVGSAAVEVPAPARARISSQALDDIAGLVLDRMKALKLPLLSGAPGIAKFLADAVLVWPFSLAIRGKIRQALQDGLCPNVEGQQPSDCAKDATTGG